MGAWIDRLREATGPDTVIRVRIDSAGDCTTVMRTINGRKAHFLVKAKTSEDLCMAMYRVPPGCWKTVDVDADGKPTRQVAEVNFARREWLARGLEVRVIAVRSKERDTGKQLYLWGDSEWTAQAFLTNDLHGDADELAHQYDGRAGVEPLIAELKGSWGIGKVPSESFVANHAALLLKLLTLNLLRRYVFAIAPTLALWRAPWIRRALIVVPGRFGRHGPARHAIAGRRRRGSPAGPRSYYPMQCTRQPCFICMDHKACGHQFNSFINRLGIEVSVSSVKVTVADCPLSVACLRRLFAA